MTNPTAPDPNAPDPDVRGPANPGPSPDSPPLNGGLFGRPARRQGAGRTDAVPLMETVRVTAPDLKRRAMLEKMRSRLVITAAGFTALFAAAVVKLALATIVIPVTPHRPDRQAATLAAANAPKPVFDTAIPGQRAMITDRNGQALAISMSTVSVFADPRQIIDAADAAAKLKTVLPRIDGEKVRARLESGKKFVYLERQITPREELAINNLGIPGIDFRPTQQRHYPLGRTASQVLGGVDVDEIGVAGVEAFFDKRLREDNSPLRLSVDVRVQAVVREELLAAMQTFLAIGACGIVMDVNTGEVLAMVSLPDYDANKFRGASDDDRFNRAVTGMYEPGSTYKLQTASMALDSGIVHIWDSFDASRPISIGRFTITDFEGKHRWLMLPEVLAYSSNLGAAHIAQAVGSERQRNWLREMGMFSRVGIELPEAGRPIVQPAANWKEIVTLTVGFGHGISVSPLHVVRGTAAIANGGIVRRPTILALPPGAEPEGTRVMQQSTSDLMRRLMRLIVTDGFGKAAEVPGYYPGGKTGTAEKVAAHGGYKKHANVAAFMSVFPMNAPRYAVYMMLDEPHGNKNTYGYATAGWVAAPAAGKVIARIGPMLGMLPDIQNMPAINQALAIPLQPGRPPGAPARGPGAPATAAAKPNPSAARPPAAIPATIPAPAPVSRDPRQQAAASPPPVLAPVTPVNAAR
jgi:cell division protein FtsI (penicillin-binding protein 3)